MSFFLQSRPLLTLWRMPWSYFKVFTFSLLQPETWSFFLVSLPWEPDKVPGGKTPKYGGPQNTGPSVLSHSHKSPHSLSSNSSKFTFMCFSSLWLSRLLLQLSWSWLWFSLFSFLSRFPRDSVHCDLNSLKTFWTHK